MMETGGNAQQQTAFRSQGNPYYAAPEQLLGDRSQPSPRPLFGGRHSLPVGHRTGAGQVGGKNDGLGPTGCPEPAQADLEADLVAWIEGLQHPDIDQRFPSVEAVRQSLIPPPPPPPAAPVPSAPEPPAKPALQITPSGKLGPAQPKPAAPPPPPAPAKKGGLADKFKIWNYLLGKKKAPEVEFLETRAISSNSSPT